MPRRYSTCTPCWPAFTRSATGGVAYFWVRSSSTKREADVVPRQLLLVASREPTDARLASSAPNVGDGVKLHTPRGDAVARRAVEGKRARVASEHEAYRAAAGQLCRRQPFERRERDAAPVLRAALAHRQLDAVAVALAAPHLPGAALAHRVEADCAGARLDGCRSRRPRHGDASGRGRCSPSMSLRRCAVDVGGVRRAAWSDDGNVAGDARRHTRSRQPARRRRSSIARYRARSCSPAAAAPRRRRSSSPRVPAATARDACACRRAAPAAALRAATGAPSGRPAPAHDRRRTCKRCRAGAARTRPAAHRRRARGRHRRTRDRDAAATPATRRQGASSRRRASRRRPTAPGSRNARRARVRAAAPRGVAPRPTCRRSPAAGWRVASCRRSSACVALAAAQQPHRAMDAERPRALVEQRQPCRVGDDSGGASELVNPPALHAEMHQHQEGASHLHAQQHHAPRHARERRLPRHGRCSRRGRQPAAAVARAVDRRASTVVSCRRQEQASRMATGAGGAHAGSNSASTRQRQQHHHRERA